MQNTAGTGKRPYTAQSLDRALQILTVLRDHAGDDLSLQEIAQRLGLHKSTVHRLLATLERHGFLAQEASTRRYRLGLAFLEFAHCTVERLEVRRHALRPMHALAHESGESVYLSVLSGDRTVCIDEIVPPGGVTLGSNVGVALPLHLTGSGKCFLSWMPARERAAVLARTAAQFAVDRAALLAELQDVRRLGYAVNDEQTEPGVRYVAAPVFAASGAVIATLSLGVSALRVSQAELPQLGPAVVRAAARVSTSLGYGEAVPASLTMRKGRRNGRLSRTEEDAGR